MTLNLTDTADQARRLRLVAAAQAAVAWARAREATWEETPSHQAARAGLEPPVPPGEAAAPPRPSKPVPPLQAVSPATPPALAARAQTPFRSPIAATLFAGTEDEEPGPPPASAADRLVERARAAAWPRGRWLVRAAVLGVLIVGGVKGRGYWQGRPAVQNTGVVVLDSLPAGSTVAVDGRLRGTLSIVPPRSTITVSATAPAEVWIDGVPVGQTPLVDQPIDVGTREVVVTSAGGDERRLVLTVTAKPSVLTVDFSNPNGR